MKIYSSMTELIGHTPLLRMAGFSHFHGLTTEIVAKLELFNPAGSVKDRAAYSMIADCEKRGLLSKPGDTIIEPTSGNTGIGLAAIGALRGYRVIFTMPETMSVERRKLLKAYGAEIVLTDGKKGMRGAIEKAEELNREIKGSVIPGQFKNPANPSAHEVTTGPEIWEDSGHKVDIFVAGIGTGGTVTGVGRYLKTQDPSIKIIGVEPAESAVLSGEAPGAHGIQGIGAGFIPDVLDTSVYDEIIKIPTAAAISCAKEIAHTEGILVGISSGAAAAAAVKAAMRPENDGKMIVALMPDTGERYLSTELFE